MLLCRQVLGTIQTPLAAMADSPVRQILRANKKHTGVLFLLQELPFYFNKLDYILFFPATACIKDYAYKEGGKPG